MFERGDLLLVPFPFSDLSATKRRPVVALPVTSRPQSENGLPLTARDLSRGVLPAPSWIRVDRIVTLSASLVVKTIGHVNDEMLGLSIERFCAHIGFRR